MATKKKTVKAPKPPKPRKNLYVVTDASGWPMEASTTKDTHLNVGEAEFQYQLVKLVKHNPVPPDAPDTF